MLLYLNLILLILLLCSCSPSQGYRLLATAMINLSFGQRKFDLGRVISSPFSARMPYQAGQSFALSSKTTKAEHVQQAQHYQDRQMQAVSEEVFFFLNQSLT